MVVERRIALLIAAAVIAFVLFTAWRNEPFTDPNAVAMLRIVLALAMGILGATLPGFLNLTWRGSGLVVRAAGALALVVLALVYTPSVLGPAGGGTLQLNQGSFNSNTVSGAGGGVQINRGQGNSNVITTTGAGGK